MAQPYTFNALGKRLKGISDTIAGVGIICVEIVVVDGEIEYITRPTVKMIEPRNRRDDFVRLLAYGSRACSDIIEIGSAEIE